MSAQPSLLSLARPQPVAEVTFGQVKPGETGGWIIDARPFVMIRARALFKSSQSVWNGGTYTHNPIIIAATQDNAKDLVWFIDRYPLTIPPSIWERVDELAARYDRAVLAANQGATDESFTLSPNAFQMAEPARPHQASFRNLWRKVQRLLLADGIGKGKTCSAITGLCEPDQRPALIVVPAHLTRQWQTQVKRFLPDVVTHIIKGTKTYPLPPADVYITAYTRLKGWEDILVPKKLRTVIFDEVQDLRHEDTVKRKVSRAISDSAEFVTGLSATPIYNMGGEIWSVLDVIYPDCLGDRVSFVKEWCTGDRVADATALNSFLTSRGLMLRRVDPPGAVTKSVITLDADIESLESIQNVAKMLAMSVLSGNVETSSDSAMQLDWKLRHATGVAKAKAVAEFVKMLVAQGEKVFLAGWHRDTYAIWERELRGLHTVMYTGTESPSEKDRSVKSFASANGAKVFICSLRSGAGLDGLQHVCSNVVIGELDWSPHVMDQIIGRLDREGQKNPVNAYYMTIDDGADPFMMELLGDKRSQHEGVIEGRQGEVEILADIGVRSDRIREMAAAYLISIGEALPNPEPQTGLHAEIAAALRKLSIPSNTEREMQEALWSVLPGMIDAEAHREYRIGERGRLDFLFVRGNERVAIECKIDQTGRGSVYRQVRRYAEEAQITGMILLAPWSGVASFIVAGVPVTVVDWSKRRLG